MPASSPLEKLCNTLQGPGGLERRQLTYKGMVGKAWDELVGQWGVGATAAKRTRKELFNIMQELLPAIATLHHAEVHKREQSERTTLSWNDVWIAQNYTRREEAGSMTETNCGAGPGASGNGMRGPEECSTRQERRWTMKQSGSIAGWSCS